MFRRLFSRRNMFNRRSKKPKTISSRQSNTPQLTQLEAIHMKIAEQAYKQQRINNIDGYDYKKPLSSITTAVYFNPSNRHLIIGYRGTNSAQDVKTDWNVVKHDESKTNRFKKDLDEYKQIVAQLKPVKITLTAHSLGGGIAMYINDNTRTVDHVYAINPAFNLNNVFKSYDKKKNVTVYRTKNDLVSMASVFGGYDVKTIPSKFDGFYGSHKMSNFTGSR